MSNASVSHDKYPDDTRGRIATVGLALEGAMGLLSEFHDDDERNAPIWSVLRLAADELERLNIDAEKHHMPKEQPKLKAA